MAAIETISKVVEGTAASEKGFPEITFMNIFFMFLTNKVLTFIIAVAMVTVVIDLPSLS